MPRPANISGWTPPSVASAAASTRPCGVVMSCSRRHSVAPASRPSNWTRKRTWPGRSCASPSGASCVARASARYRRWPDDRDGVSVMSFLWPGNLFLILVVPALIAAYVWAQRRRQKYALRYASLSLVREALGKGPGRKRHVPPALFLIALFFMALGTARPETVVTVPVQEGTVILALDVSGSMLA